jgi:hypothetical protein
MRDLTQHFEGTPVMTAQTMQKQEVVAVFSSRREADQAKQTLQTAGLGGQQFYIDDHVSPSVQVAAQGTTVGKEAGFLIGLFLGGVVGLVATIIITFWMTGDYPQSNLSRIMVLVSALAGAMIGTGLGKANFARKPVEEQIKGNPIPPRRYRLMILGSKDDMREAQRALGQPAVDY